MSRRFIFEDNKKGNLVSHSVYMSARTISRRNVFPVLFLALKHDELRTGKFDHNLHRIKNKSL